MDLRRINFGIEIETVKRTRERVAQAIKSVVGGQVRHIGSPGSFDPWEVTDDHGWVWKAVSDGSLINVPIHLRAEVVSPVLSLRGHPRPPGGRPGAAPLRGQNRPAMRHPYPCGRHRIWYGYHNRQPQHYDSTRYHGVNLHNVWYRGTVEFRWFEGTLYAGKVRAYVQLVLAVMPRR